MFCEHRNGSPISIYVNSDNIPQVSRSLTPSVSIVVASYSGNVHATGLLEPIMTLAPESVYEFNVPFPAQPYKL